MYVETEARKLRERLGHIEENVDTAKATFESVNKIVGSIAENRQRHPGISKPVGEFKAVQQLKASAGDRSKNPRVEREAAERVGTGKVGLPQGAE